MKIFANSFIYFLKTKQQQKSGYFVYLYIDHGVVLK